MDRRTVDRPTYRQTTHRRHKVSLTDVPFLFASLFLSFMRAVPGSHRVRLIDQLSPFLALLLHKANLHPTQTIRSNMQELLGSDRATGSTEADVRRLVTLVIWNSLVSKVLPTLSAEQIRNLAAIEGTSLLDERLDSGRPVLVWGYHFGIETAIVVVLLSKMGYPIHAVTHIRHTPAKGSILRLPYYAQLQSLADHFSLIDPGEGVQRKMLDVLRSHECLFVTPDYMIPPDEMPPMASSVVPVDMLGRQVQLHTGGLRLAKRLDAQVVKVYSAQADGSNRRLVVEPFELPSSGLRPTDLQQDLQMCMGWLEQQVLAHPYWWLDFKRSDLLLRLEKPQAELFESD